MKHKVFHGRLGSVGFEETVTNFPKKGNLEDFTPILSSTRAEFESRINTLGLSPPTGWLFDTSEMEILANKKLDKGIIFLKGGHRFDGVDPLPGDAIEMLVFGKDETEVLENVLNRVFKKKVKELSWCEIAKILELEKSSGEISANGKLLSNETIKAAAKALYDDGLREKVKKCLNSNTSLKELQISNHHLKVVKQGLWLELLAKEIMDRHCSKAWAGQFFNSNEIDVIGTISDYTVLIECKDRSFGLKDLFFTIEKANDVWADIVILITTQPLHANVKLKIPSAKSQLFDEGDLIVISEKQSGKIQSQLSKILTRLSADYYERWMNWPMPERYPPF